MLLQWQSLWYYVFMMLRPWPDSQTSACMMTWCQYQSSVNGAVVMCEAQSPTLVTLFIVPEWPRKHWKVLHGTAWCSIGRHCTAVSCASAAVDSWQLTWNLTRHNDFQTCRLVNETSFIREIWKGWLEVSVLTTVTWRLFGKGTALLPGLADNNLTSLPRCVEISVDEGQRQQPADCSCV